MKPMNRILLAIILFLAAAIAPAQTIKLVHPYDTNAFSAKFPTDDKILHRSSTTTLSDGTIGYIEDYLQNGESVVSFVCYTEFPKSFIFGTSIADEMLNGMEEKPGRWELRTSCSGAGPTPDLGPFSRGKFQRLVLLRTASLLSCSLGAPESPSGRGRP